MQKTRIHEKKHHHCRRLLPVSLRLQREEGKRDKGPHEGEDTTLVAWFCGQRPNVCGHCRRTRGDGCQLHEHGCGEAGTGQRGASRRSRTAHCRDRQHAGPERAQRRRGTDDAGQRRPAALPDAARQRFAARGAMGGDTKQGGTGQVAVGGGQEESGRLSADGSCQRHHRA